MTDDTTETRTIQLPCDLDENEKKLLGDQISLLVETIDQHETTTKSINAERKKQLDDMKTKLRTMWLAKNSGSMIKEVICVVRVERVQLQYGERYDRVTFRSDTGEEIHREPCSADELEQLRQVRMFPDATSGGEGDAN